jgi:hypothetical protein
MRGKQTQRGDAGRAYGLGFEFVCAVAGFLLVGIWIDRHFGSGQAATLICLLLGLIGGFYNLIRGASRLAAGPKAAPGAQGAMTPPASPPSPSGAQPADSPAPRSAVADQESGSGIGGPGGRGGAGTPGDAGDPGSDTGAAREDREPR